MKKKTAIKWIDRSLIESPSCIGLCLSKKDFKAEMKRLKVPNPPKWITDGKDGMTHFFSYRGRETAIVCIKQHNKPIETVGLIIHEAVHIYQYIKQNLNENNPSKEFEAYSIQTIAQRLIDKVGER